MGGNGSKSGLSSGAGLSDEEKARIVEAAMNIGGTKTKSSKNKVDRAAFQEKVRELRVYGNPYVDIRNWSDEDIQKANKIIDEFESKGVYPALTDVEAMVFEDKSADNARISSKMYKLLDQLEKGKLDAEGENTLGRSAYPKKIREQVEADVDKTLSDIDKAIRKIIKKEPGDGVEIYHYDKGHSGGHIRDAKDYNQTISIDSKNHFGKDLGMENLRKLVRKFNKRNNVQVSATVKTKDIISDGEKVWGYEIYKINVAGAPRLPGIKYYTKKKDIINEYY